MNRNIFIAMLAAAVAASCMAASEPQLELVSVARIWDKAPHNAFTDLLHWKDSFYCAFREGRGHVSIDGRIRVLRSETGESWESATLIAMDGYDLRDAHLCTTPDHRLMLVGGAAPRKKDNERCPTGTFVSFSADGADWSEPVIAVEPGRWLWQVTWHKGKAYGVAYGNYPTTRCSQLLVSDDGVDYNAHVSDFLCGGRPTEATLRFAGNGACYALSRRDRSGNEPTSAMFGVSRGDYKKWTWHDLGAEFNSFGGPNFIQLPFGQWIAAGRMHQGGAHTALTLLDVEKRKMTKLLKLPSGGDTSYPGLAWHDDLLNVSYYSSHEGKTSIYLARVKAKVGCPKCGRAMTTVPMLVGMPNEAMAKQMRQGKVLLAGCVGDPYNPEIACVCLNCRKWKTKDMKYWQDLPTQFGQVAAVGN